MRDSRPSVSAEELAKTKAEHEQLVLNAAIEKQNTRRWRAGDVYAPHDLSSIEMKKWKQRRMVKGDAFEALNLDPRSEYKVCGNPLFCSLWPSGPDRDIRVERDWTSWEISTRIDTMVLKELYGVLLWGVWGAVLTLSHY